MFTYGGLRGSALLDDFLLADDSTGSADLSVCDPRSQAWYGPSPRADLQFPSVCELCACMELCAPKQPPAQSPIACSVAAVRTWGEVLM